MNITPITTHKYNKRGFPTDPSRKKAVTEEGRAMRMSQIQAELTTATKRKASATSEPATPTPGTVNQNASPADETQTETPKASNTHGAKRLAPKGRLPSEKQPETIEGEDWMEKLQSDSEVWDEISDINVFEVIMPEGKQDPKGDEERPKKKPRMTSPLPPTHENPLATDRTPNPTPKPSRDEQGSNEGLESGGAATNDFLAYMLEAIDYYEGKEVSPPTMIQGRPPLPGGEQEGMILAVRTITRALLEAPRVAPTLPPLPFAIPLAQDGAQTGSNAPETGRGLWHVENPLESTVTTGDRPSDIIREALTDVSWTLPFRADPGEGRTSGGANWSDRKGLVEEWAGASETQAQAPELTGRWGVETAVPKTERNAPRPDTMRTGNPNPIMADYQDAEERARELTRLGIMAVTKKPVGGFPRRHRVLPNDATRYASETDMAAFNAAPEGTAFFFEEYDQPRLTTPETARKHEIAAHDLFSTITLEQRFRIKALGLSGKDKVTGYLCTGMSTDGVRIIKSYGTWSTKQFTAMICADDGPDDCYVMTLKAFAKDDRIDLQDAAENPPMNVADAASEVLKSVRIEHANWGSIDPRGKPAIVVNVYCGLFGEEAQWLRWRDEVRSLKFTTRENGVPRVRAFRRCDGCQAADHPYHMCTYRTIPGWQAPQRSDVETWDLDRDGEGGTSYENRTGVPRPARGGGGRRNGAPQRPYRDAPPTATRYEAGRPKQTATSSWRPAPGGKRWAETLVGGPRPQPQHGQWGAVWEDTDDRGRPLLLNGQPDPGRSMETSIWAPHDGYVPTPQPPRLREAAAEGPSSRVPERENAGQSAEWTYYGQSTMW
ncbi:hypothetical protein C8Q78DRAFT_988025 [Trametes maxima]|nr:hypothetical protein C8Q78DRAFT_988025 [Trametes maxima]